MSNLSYLLKTYSHSQPYFPRNCYLGITMEKILNDSVVLSNEAMPKPELTQRRRRLEERMDQRKIDNEIDYLEELRDRIQH